MNRPNILILMSDEHNFRFMSFRDRFGDHEPVHTPIMDRMAENGIYFDRAYTQIPLCTPARMCFMTGRYPHRCGALVNGSVLDPQYETMPRYFGRHGYETCLVGKMHFGGALQFHGFQHRIYGDFGGRPSHQADPIPGSARGSSQSDSSAELPSWRRILINAGETTIPEGMLQENVVARESVAFVREHTAKHPDKPWLLCASFSRPHFPLTAPRRHLQKYWPSGVTPPIVGRTGDAFDHPMSVGARAGFHTDEVDEGECLKARAAYFACVDFLDEVIGDMLACLERSGHLENTIVVYVSDHGELAGEHGLWFKTTWHDGSMRIPLIFQLPEHRAGARAGEIRGDLAGIIDIFPTLCSLAGLSIPEGIDGIDLGLDRADVGGSSHMRERSPRLMGEWLTPRWGEGTEYRVAMRGSYKYVGFRDAPELLFDLKDDPHEQRNLAASVDDNVARVLEELRRVALGDFDWDAACARLADESNNLIKRYGKRLRPKGSNQYILPDGRMVESEDMLYHPTVVSLDPSADFADFPRSNAGPHPE